MSKRLLNIWRNMRQRCNNPNNTSYKYYGGRGIGICSQWQDFKQFAADMGEPPSDEHTIDRIDNDGDYSPGNCRWQTRQEQAHNRRIMSHNTSGINGVSFCNTMKKWHAYLCHKGRDISLGRFVTKRKAVVARDKYIIENGLPHRLSPFFSAWVKRHLPPTKQE